MSTVVRHIRSVALTAAVLCAAGIAAAQEATPAKPPSPMQGCCGRHDTSGWSMMTRQERQEHRAKMMGMSDHGGCMAYMQEHHSKMMERAKQRGVNMPAQPRRDACAALKR
jgi:hypothetical protein